MRGQSGCAPACKEEDSVSTLLRGSPVKNSTENGEAWCGPYLCGLPLLLELLQLLCREETHRLVASNELRARRHGGEDNVAAQPAKAVKGRRECGMRHHGVL